MIFIEYPKCSTCRQAKAILKQKTNQKIESIDIVKNTPTIDEIRDIHQKSGVDIIKLFNTSGNVYKQLNLKEKLPLMTLEEKYALLASNGMLIKRPILIDGDQVYIGNRHDIYKE